MQKLNNILLNNIWVKGEILKYFELNENVSFPSLRSAVKAELRGGFPASDTYI